LVAVVDERTIAFPSYDGNHMHLCAGNVLLNPAVGLLFIDFERCRRLRLNGAASIDDADALLPTYPETQFGVRVRAREVFPNCPRYIHRRQLVARSEYVPTVDCPTPVPGWKRATGRATTLRRTTPARTC
jgi:hypothetical protein